MKKTQPTPEPVPVNVVCSLCGEPWHLHQAKSGEITTLECIRLLKAKSVVYPTVIYRDRYPVWPNQPTYPYQPRWIQSTGSVSQFQSSLTAPQTINCASSTPKVLSASAAA